MQLPIPICPILSLAWIHLELSGRSASWQPVTAPDWVMYYTVRWGHHDASRSNVIYSASLIARFMGPTWGPPGADRTHVGPMWAPWKLLSGISLILRTPPKHVILNVGFNHGLPWCVKYMAWGTPGTTKPDGVAGGLCGDRRPEGHVFHTSRQAMIKTYYSTSTRIKYGTKL